MAVSSHAGHVTLPDGGGQSVTNGVIAADRFDAWQCNWKVDLWKAVGKSFDKEALSYETDNGTVMLKFSASGTVKVSGGFADARGKIVKASGSATLLPTVGDDGETHYPVFVYLTPKGLPPHAQCLEVSGLSGL